MPGTVLWSNWCTESWEAGGLESEQVTVQAHRQNISLFLHICMLAACFLVCKVH